VLFVLSLFLFTYPGYEHVIADRVIGCVGGAAALGVALFPTTAPEGLSAPPWWNPRAKDGALYISGHSLPIVHPFCCLALSQIKCSQGAATT
jgi:hypothetical protein